MPATPLRLELTVEYIRYTIYIVLLFLQIMTTAGNATAELGALSTWATETLEWQRTRLVTEKGRE